MDTINFNAISIGTLNQICINYIFHLSDDTVLTVLILFMKPAKMT